MTVLRQNVYGSTSIGIKFPEGNRDYHQAGPQENFPLPTPQKDCFHAKIRFTIRQGTTIVFWTVFPPHQPSKSGWARTMTSISSRVA